MREKKPQEQPQSPRVEPYARAEDIHAMHQVAAQHRARADQHETEAVRTLTSARAQADELVRRAQQDAAEHVRRAQDEAAELVRGAQEQAAMHVAQAEEQAAAQRGDRDEETRREQYWVELAAQQAVKAGLPTTVPAELAPGALTETRGDMAAVENGGPTS